MVRYIVIANREEASRLVSELGYGRGVEVVIPPNVAQDKYAAIVDELRKGVDFNIWNPRPEGYAPPTLTFAVSSVKEVRAMKSTPEQTVLIATKEEVSSSEYQEIYKEASLRGYLVINGPYSNIPASAGRLLTFARPATEARGWKSILAQMVWCCINLFILFSTLRRLGFLS